MERPKQDAIIPNNNFQGSRRAYNKSSFIEAQSEYIDHLEAENKELKDKLEEYVVYESVKGILKIQIRRDTLNELLNNK